MSSCSKKFLCGDGNLTMKSHSPSQSVDVSPLGALSSLQVKEQRRDNLVHVLRVPDVCLQLVFYRLSHDTLQAFNSCHADAAGDKDRDTRTCTRKIDIAVSRCSH